MKAHVSEAIPATIVYPIPMDRGDVWELFKPFVERFIATYKQFRPGYPHKIVAVCNGKVEGSGIEEMFSGLPVTFSEYGGEGADIGTFQDAAPKLGTGMMVCCVTRVYFHRANWLARLMEARYHHGPGLYGTSASREGGSLHVCCRCYAMDADLFNLYPDKIMSRDQGVFFELGKGNLMQFFRSHGLVTKIVYWNTVCDPEFAPAYSHTFRQGNQENLLVFDKHTDIYRDADPVIQKQLFDRMMGK